MSRPDVEIVRMERAHLPEILAIERASYENPWPEEAFVHEVEANPVGFSLVATQASRVSIVGYAVTWIVFENLHIQNVTVHPGYRRSGIARTLLDRAFDEGRSRRASIALLEVRPSNEAALSLYRSLGFTEEGVRESYYSSPVEDALMFRRELEAPENGR